jgi:hypothetical protein
MSIIGEFYSYNRLKDLIDYGKNEPENLKKVLKYLSHNNTVNFDDWEVVEKYYILDNNLNYIKKQSNCSCKHHIEQPFKVRNKFNNNEKIVGSVCIKKYYNDEAKEKLKELIFEDKGKKRCNACNGKRAVDKKTVEENIDQEFFYHPGCMKIKFTKCCECKKYKNYNCKCPPLYELPKLNINIIVKFGKYKGQPIKNILNDKSYCEWILNLTEVTGQLKEIQEFILTL